jgi:hypothetical protein
MVVGKPTGGIRRKVKFQQKYDEESKLHTKFVDVL